MTKLLAALVLALCAGISASAWAQTAEELAAEATAAFQQGDYAVAIERFEQAFELDPHPVILFNLARAYQQVGDLPGALLRFRSIRSMNAPGQVRDAAEAKVEEIESELRAMGYDPDVVTAADYVPRGTLTVTSQPEGAAVYVNGQYRGVTPYVQERIDQGLYALRVELDGYHPINGEVDVRGGRNNLRTYSLSPRTTLEEYIPPAPGYLTIRAPVSGLEIELDGTPYGYTPMLAHGVPAGTYTVTLHGDGWLPYSAVVEVVGNQETELIARMEAEDERSLIDPNRGRRQVGTALMAAGAAAVVTGGVFGVVALNQAADYRDSPSDPDRGALRDDARRSARISDVGIVAGGAIFVTGSVLHWIGGRGNSDVDRDLLVTPVVGPDRAGLVVRTRF
ncbi:MAG: PEGA domain-containing protein [Myxococcales bacterium]|nr:PEGA domain-containing protein [Myxococcales bacterium]